MSTVASPQPRRALGIGALVCAILAPVWLFGGFYSVLLATRDDAPAVVTVLANVSAFGWFVVPLATLAALVLGILAIVLRRGRALGAAALVVLAIDAVLVVLYVAAAFGAFGAL
ncbi:MAG: hypothetical protein KKH51_13730 [Actinobacteria bacterium]|nr:hypothetical protein [Actinomycetota bacterium]